MSRYIDADAIDWSIVEDEYGKRTDSVVACEILIENQSTIDAVEVVHGEWILLEPRYPIEQKVYWNKEQALADTKGNGARERRKCSCCGYTKSFMCHMKDEQIKLWNFCPNCGAKMKGADDEGHNIDAE